MASKWHRSPSYEGVDWNTAKLKELKTALVLPLTREWIEIKCGGGTEQYFEGSPSYEGVDWNGRRCFGEFTENVLPLTREWIEICISLRSSAKPLFSLLRGSGLKWAFRRWCCPRRRFSLLRGSGLKFSDSVLNALCSLVLPLTREWIEMSFMGIVPITISVLPLTREWIEISRDIANMQPARFSLLRGSGLKW